MSNGLLTKQRQTKHRLRVNRENKSCQQSVTFQVRSPIVFRTLIYDSERIVVFKTSSFHILPIDPTIDPTLGPQVATYFVSILVTRRSSRAALHIRWS